MTLGETVILIAVLAGMALTKWLLPSYLAEKGKNLATREDVEELTRRVEGVRAQYLQELERLRVALTEASQVSKAQYDAEFKTYEEIWEKLVDVHRATISLRPILDHVLGEGETEASRRAKRLEAFGTSFSDFTRTVWKRKPFYPDEVFKELEELIRIAHSEAVGYEVGRPDEHREYWEEAMQNGAKLTAQIEKIGEVIRKRLSRVGVA